MNHFKVRSLILGVLLLTLSFLVAVFSPSFSPVFLISHAQGSQDSKYWVFDGHMHPIGRSGNMGDADYSSKFTLPMAIEGGLGAGLFNAGIDEFYEANHLAVKSILGSFDAFYRQISLNSDQVGVARNAAEVGALRRQGKIAAILSIEGAIAIESDLGVLRMMYRLGLREMNLVHNLENNIGDVQYSTKNNGRGSGLTGYGRELVAEMNRLGIVIDMSHMAEQTAWDVMKVSTQPVVTTHSGVRALVKRPGTWSDEMIQELAQKGGVICIPFLLPQLISQEYHNKWHAGRPPRGSGLMGWEPLVYRGDPTKIYDFIAERTGDPQAGQSERTRQRQLDRPPLSNLIDAIDHVVRLVGADTVGISSDAGGDRVNLQGIENVGEYQNIAQALLKRGYSEGDVAKIMGENLLRTFDQVTR